LSVARNYDRKINANKRLGQKILLESYKVNPEGNLCGGKHL